MLPAPERLRANAEFQRVYKTGESFVEGLVVLYLLRTPDSPARQAGFSVSKKLGNAVVRNRTKRRLRDAYERLLPVSSNSLPPNGGTGGFQAVFVARKAAAEAPYEDLERAMRKVLARAGF